MTDYLQETVDAMFGALRQDYLVWSNEHHAWWGPNNAGYYRKLEAAGHYTRADALKICVNARGGRRYNENPSEVPVLLSDAEVFWPDETEEDRATKHRIREQERLAEERTYSSMRA
jgi:hypothetical protein